MHEIDRTQLDHGRHHEQFLGNLIGAVAGGELEVPLTEVQELELASELLEVTNEEELEQFLGDVFHSVGNAVGQFVRSDTGRALGGILKDAAGKALPAIGQAVGQQFGGSTGADWGGRIGQAAGSLLGLELEGLSHPEQELEAARQFVRFAGAATNQALDAPTTLSPDTVAQAAATAAAHRFAPGIAHELGVRGPLRYPRPPGFEAGPRFAGRGYGRFGSRNGMRPFGPRPGWRGAVRPGMPYGPRRFGQAGAFARPYGPRMLGRPMPPQFGPGWASQYPRHQHRYPGPPGQPWTAYGPQWPPSPGAPPPPADPPPGPTVPDSVGWLGSPGQEPGGLPPWLVQLLHALRSVGFDPAALSAAPPQPFGADPGAIPPGPPTPGVDQGGAPLMPGADPSAGAPGGAGFGLASPPTAFGAGAAAAPNGASAGTNGGPPGP